MHCTSNICHTTTTKEAAALLKYSPVALTAPWHILLQTAINDHQSTAAVIKKKKETEPVNWEILPDVALPYSSTSAMCTVTDMCNVNQPMK